MLRASALLQHAVQTYTVYVHYAVIVLCIWNIYSIKIETLDTLFDSNAITIYRKSISDIYFSTICVNIGVCFCRIIAIYCWCLLTQVVLICFVFAIAIGHPSNRYELNCHSGEWVNDKQKNENSIKWNCLLKVYDIKVYDVEKE